MRRPHFLQLRFPRLRLHLGEKPLIRLNVGVDLATMAMIVREGRENGGQRQARVADDDLFGSHPHALVPDGNVLNLDAVAENVRLSVAKARLNRDMLAKDRKHRFGGNCGRSSRVHRHKTMITAGIV